MTEGIVQVVGGVRFEWSAANCQAGRETISAQGICQRMN